MIDWTKPLELMDGTPVRLDPYITSPDKDGDYWIVREDGEKMRAGDRFDCVNQCGMDKYVQIVRNRVTTPTETLRDRFAMAALTGLVMGPRDPLQVVAESAYAIADAMLRARGEGRWKSET